MGNLIDNIGRQIHAYNAANKIRAKEVRLGEEAYRVVMRYDVQPVDAPEIFGCKIILDRNINTIAINIC